MARRNFLQRARESLKRGRQARRQPVHRPRLLLLEYLEQRTAPSCNPGVSGGVLRVNGDNGPNEASLSHNNSTNLTRITWYGGSGYVYRDFSPSTFSSILMNMGAAADGVRILSTPPSRPVTVDGGGGLDYVEIGDGSLAGIRSEVNVKNPPSGGYTELFVYNPFDTVGRNVTISDSEIRFDGGIPVFRYAQSDLRSLGLSGGSGANTYTVLNTPNNGLPGGVATSLFLNGFATVNVRATAGELDLNDYASNNVFNVNVGNGGSVQDIHGAVVVTAPRNYITLNINDQLDPGDASGLRVPIIDTYNSAYGDTYARVSALAPAPISTRCADTERLTVRTGIGEVVPQVRSIGPLLSGLGVLTLQGNSDQTYVTVGDTNGTVQNIRGTLRIANPTGRFFTWLNVVDSSDAGHRNVSLESVIIGDGLYGQISGLAPAVIQYEYAHTLLVGVNTGTGGAAIDVSGTGIPTYLQGNGPNTSIYLGGSRGTQGLQGPVSISSNTIGSIAVDISDVADPDTRTVTLDTYMPDTEHVRVFGLTPQPIDLTSGSLQSLGIEGGSGGNTFVVQTTSAYPFPTTIYTGYGNNTVVVHGTSTSPLSVYLDGGQNDTVNLGDADNGLANIQSPVTAVGNELGSGDTLNVIDQANPNPETYVVTDTLLVTPSRTIVGHMENFDTVVLYPSLDPATAVVDVHDPGLYTLVISYDAPPGAPPPPPGAPPGGPGGGGGSAPRPTSGLMADSPQIDGVSAHFLAETARKGSMAQQTAAPASDAMLLDLLNRIAKRSSSQQALATDLAWADAMPALIRDPALA